MSTQMIVRIDSELKEKAGNLAKAEGSNISEVVRELLQDYVKSRDVSGYIDGLWDRIGMKIKEQGIAVSDIDAVISQIRSDK